MGRLIMSEIQIKEAIERLTSSITKTMKSEAMKDCRIVGIRTRGVYIAQRILQIILREEGLNLPFGTLDITLYRDDFSLLYQKPKVERTELPFEVEGKNIILVDDVLYTGRTVRAAMDQIVDFGRPKKILLVVLVDRGGREFPIHADFIGKRIDVPPPQWVEVRLKEVDGEDAVLLHERKSSS
jgi:pyrimidine operon attenuation protein/uracil phosphoribosyltransferase